MRPTSNRLSPLGIGAISLLLALVAAFFALRIVESGSRPSLDLLLYYYPVYEATASWLAAGKLPLWNPYQLAGSPWLAALQSGPLYPLHALYLLMPTHVAMAASSLLHLAIVGLATMWFARRAGLVLGAALLAGVLCAMRGRYPAWVIAPNMLEAATWLPVGAVAVQSLARTAGSRGVALLAIATASSVTAGYAQATVYAVYCWGALLLLLLFAEKTPRADLARPLAHLAFAIALGAVLAAPQLLPTLELLSQGTRSLGSLTTAQMFPFGFVENPLSAARYFFFQNAVPTLPWSFGWVGLALLPVALLDPSTRRLSLALLALAVTVVAFAIGPATPLFELLLWLPPLSSFRNPARILFVADFCFAVVAAAGLHALYRACRRTFSRSAAAHGIVGAVVLAAVVEIFIAPPNPFQLPYSGAGYTEVYHQPKKSYRRVASSPDRVLLWNPGLAPEIPSQVATLFSMRSVDGHEPLSLRRQKDYFTFLLRGTIDDPRSQPFYGRLDWPKDAAGGSQLASRQRLLDLAAVRFVLVPLSALNSPSWRRYASNAGLRSRGKVREGIQTFENPNVLPRAFVTYRALPAPSAPELLKAISREGFDPLVESYVEGDVEGDVDRGHARRDPLRGHSARIVRDEPTVVEIEARLRAPGLLVLADTFYSGWRATLGDEPLAIHATNHLFRGVALPAGSHRVRFELDRARFDIGLAASGLGVAVLVALVLRQRRFRT